MKKGVDQPFEKIIAAARSLIGHFKMSSLATNGLRAKVKEILASEHHGKGLIQDVSTRWKSTFYMLERLSLLRWPVVAVLSAQSLTKPQETRVLDMPVESWKLAGEIIPVLRKVELATVLFSSQSKTTCPSYDCRFGSTIESHDVRACGNRRLTAGNTSTRSEFEGHPRPVVD